MADEAPDSRTRLVEAALELYAQRGFDRTTAAEIAARAGLTERTFFRYFADKREVLFSGQAERRVLSALAAAPTDTAPFDAVLDALAAAEGWFAPRREIARRRQAVIDATPSLQERELMKLAALAEGIAAQLRERGVELAEAAMAGEAGATIFKAAFDAWLDDEGDFRSTLEQSLEHLRAAVCAATFP